ncbi:WAP-type 'four-disulfide core' domain [Trinorchestia longiramus]|nr:WAP-type 'four-disulfide core' domain [Trinorchestia longiramus]
MGSRLMLVVLMVVMVAHIGEGRRRQSRNQCPDPNSFGRNCFVYQDQCRSSRQCRAAGQQCCLVAGCGKECVDIAASTTTGSCPDPSSYGRTCIQYIDQCQTSSECGDGGACCLVAGCGKECVRPETEPQDNPQLRKFFSHLSPAVPAQLCPPRCPAHQVSLPPHQVSSLHHRCPPPSGLVGICVIGPNSCGSDADCSGGQLCCSEGCGSECKNPV